MRHRVIGEDERTGEALEIVLDARNERDARDKARERGVMPLRVEPADESADAGQNRRDAGRDAEIGFVDESDDDLAEALEREDHVWSGGPSQWENVVPFALCLLVVPIPWALWRWLSTRCTRFEITSQRLRMRSGVLTRTLEEIEIYRVKDTAEKQSLWQRLAGVGTVTVYSSDRTLPELLLRNVRGHGRVRDLVRAQTERMRRARKVRELDVD